MQRVGWKCTPCTSVWAMPSCTHVGFLARARGDGARRGRAARGHSAAAPRQKDRGTDRNCNVHPQDPDQDPVAQAFSFGQHWATSTIRAGDLPVGFEFSPAAHAISTCHLPSPASAGTACFLLLCHTVRCDRQVRALAPKGPARGRCAIPSFAESMASFPEENTDGGREEIRGRVSRVVGPLRASPLCRKVLHAQERQASAPNSAWASNTLGKPWNCKSATYPRPTPTACRR